MEYIYDQSKYTKYLSTSIFRAVMLFYPATIIALLTIYLSLLDSDNKLFVITITAVLSFISSSLGILFSVYKSKKYFRTLIISSNENELIYTSYNQNIQVGINQISQISEDNKGNIYISSKGNGRIFISKYLNQYDEFKNFLTMKHNIKTQNVYSNYIGFLPGIFLLGIASMKIFPYYQIYIICGLGFIFSALYSFVANLQELRKKPFNILFIAIELFIAYVIAKNLLIIFSRI